MLKLTSKNLTELDGKTAHKFDCLQFNEIGVRVAWLGRTTIGGCLHMFLEASLKGHTCIVIEASQEPDAHRSHAQQSIHDWELAKKMPVALGFAKKFALNFKSLSALAMEPTRDQQLINELQAAKFNKGKDAKGMNMIVEFNDGARGRVIEVFHAGHHDIRPPYNLKGGFSVTFTNRVGHCNVLPPKMEPQRPDEMLFSSIKSITRG